MEDMRITRIRCVTYTGTLDWPGELWEDRQHRPLDRYPEFRGDGAAFIHPLGRTAGGRYLVRSVFLHVDTDAGLTGTAGPISPEQAMVIARTKAPLLLGADPLAVERAWDVLYRASVHGRKGLDMLAISALDCALWDLRGRFFDAPVHRLLGGPTRPSAPAYASMLGASLDPEAVRTRTRQAVAEGYRAIKWFFGHGPADGPEGERANLALARTAREAAGDDVDLMFDAWMSWDVPYTLRMADRLAEIRPLWIEEPVMPDQHESYVELTRRLSGRIAIAGGEHEYTRWGLHELMRRRAMSVYQPDTYWAGGITEMSKIAALASVHDVPLIPHGHSVPANTHLTFAHPASTIPRVEYLIRANAVRQHFLANPVRPVGGEIRPPEVAGLGMDLDEDKIEAREELVFD